MRTNIRMLAAQASCPRSPHRRAMASGDSGVVLGAGKVTDRTEEAEVAFRDHLPFE